MRRIRRFLGISTVFISLTVLTQIGGLAYLCGLAAGRIVGRRVASPALARTGAILTGVLVYAALTAIVIPPLAASLGRVRLPCGDDGGPVVAATPLTCALNRGYVRPEVRDVLMALGTEMGRRFPGSRVTTLEGNFPFGDGFPLLPHLSHRDGKKVDIAFFYRDDTTGPVGHGSPSWLGYFIYEQPMPGDRQPCSGRWAPLRWDFPWFQPDPPRWRLDEQRTAWMGAWLKNNPNVSRLFLEPHLADRLGLVDGKVRFQGCRAARHDDHIHVDVP